MQNKNKENSSSGKQNSSSRQGRGRIADSMGIQKYDRAITFPGKSTRPDIAYAVHQCDRVFIKFKSIAQNGCSQNRKILDGDKVRRPYFGTNQQLTGTLV